MSVYCNFNSSVKIKPQCNSTAQQAIHKYYKSSSESNAALRLSNLTTVFRCVC